MENRIVEVQAKLEAIIEELTDISVEVLRQAVEAGETVRPPVEKKLSQARRAVEKAARTLDGVSRLPDPYNTESSHPWSG